MINISSIESGNLYTYSMHRVTSKVGNPVCVEKSAVVGNKTIVTNTLLTDAMFMEMVDKVIGEKFSETFRREISDD